jgi:hypothetical protein
MNNYNLNAMKSGIIALMMLASIITLPVSAQNPKNPNLERLNAYKIAFFTKRLNLTSSEAEKFWPLYNEFQESRNKIQRERLEIFRNFNQNELNMSENEMADAGDRLVTLETREASLAQEFHNKIKGVLSAEKIMRMYQAENQYRLQLLKELQERREGVRKNPNLRNN